MGLLGDGWDSDQSQMVMGLAQGLLSARGGAGLSAGLGGMQAAQQQAMKNKLLDAQMKNYDSEIEARKLAGIKDARQQSLIASIWGGGGGEAAPPGAFAPASDGMGPTIPPQMQQQQQGGGGLAAMTPDMVARLKLGGLDLTDIYKFSQEPQKYEPGSTYRDRNTGQERFIPKVGEGIAPDKHGFYGALPGYAEAQAGIEGGKAGAVAAAQSRYKPREVFDPVQQRMVILPESTVLGDQAPQGAQGGSPGITNPGNLRPRGASTGFANYDTPVAGLKALDDNLQAYGAKGVNTISKIINRWAPPSENNTAAYVSAVAKRLGVNPDQPLDMQSPIVRQMLSTAITLHEHGPSRVFGASRPAQQSAQAGGFAAGPSADETALAKANETRTVESAKAGSARIMSGYDNAQAASESITAIRESRKAIQGGSFVGSGAETKLALSKGLQSLGFDVKPEQVSNTDYLNSQLGQGILNKAKTLGANPTDNDARIIRDIVGSIGKDPQALNRLLDFQESMAQRSIDQHNKNYGEAKKRGFDPGFDLKVNAPDKPAAAAPPLPTNPSAQNLTKGQAYKLPNGAEAVWDGMRFKGK